LAENYENQITLSPSIILSEAILTDKRKVKPQMPVANRGSNKIRRFPIMQRTKKAWINGVFLVITLIINSMGAFGLINGLSQKEISDRYITLITPAPSTFSIWSVIYLLLLLSMIVMIMKKDDLYYQRAIDDISNLFRISCILNVVWIIAFSYVQIELSVLFIFAFLITLALIGKKLLAIQKGKHFLLPLCFGIYTGWLLIATVVNIAAALVKIKWDGFGIASDTWAIIILVIALGLTFVVLMSNRNAAFPLPIAWAYFGIYQFLTAPEGFKGEYGLLQIVAIIGAFVLLGMAVIQLLRNHFALLPEGSVFKIK
jgi:translocator protein